MPTRKIAEPGPIQRCRSREHLPPQMMVFSPGTYEHTCPQCGHVTMFTIYPKMWM